MPPMRHIVARIFEDLLRGTLLLPLSKTSGIDAGSRGKELV
jgi:hypothetical protein